MKEKKIIPIILCGGTGSRLWPLSRESYPKQYLKLASNDKHSLLQNTYERISEIENIADPIIVCNEEHRFIVAEQMREINIKPNSILLEPFGRNTAPAILVSALVAIEKEKDPILLVLSADHEIKEIEKFHKAIGIGIKHAWENQLVIFGVIPSSAETGYGYIKSKTPFKQNDNKGITVEKFIEKPSSELAKKLIKDKHFTWNSGMFVFKAKKIIEEIKKFSPEIYKYTKSSVEKSKHDLDFRRLDKSSFFEVPNLSIDVAVMEKTKESTVVPLDAGWSDIGSWKAVWDNSLKDSNGNSIQGKNLVYETKNSYIRSENRLVVGIGLNNLIVIETNDAILIADQKNSQDVKKIVSILKDQEIKEGRTHRRIYRPWGNYLSIVEASDWQVKLINVKPGEKLSLQMHHHRSEHWIVVSGTARAEIDDKIVNLSENQSTYIPLGSKHRLTNPGKIPLELIEVQSGKYLGEDDIVRFEDKYGRTN